MTHKIKKLLPTHDKYIQGFYRLRYPEKYIGDETRVIYRSSWERRFCIYCENSDRVIKWSIEPFSIKYYNPFDKKLHEYNVDFYVKMYSQQNIIEEFLVEIKPKSKLSKPKPPKKQTLKQLKNYNNLQKEFVINCAKFAAAHAFAIKRGLKFMVITEEFLFNEKNMKDAIPTRKI